MLFVEYTFSSKNINYSNLLLYPAHKQQDQFYPSGPRFDVDVKINRRRPGESEFSLQNLI